MGRGIQGRDIDAVVVGAGFAGLYMLHRLRQGGFTAQGFEAGDDVGGTWYWNRYPGARCDVESLEYSYGFSDELQQDWEWSERYAAQPEILDYLGHVADRFDLRSHIRFGTRVVAATFDERADRWRVETDEGTITSARFLIMATGCLSSANLPDIPGRDTFAGDVVHTGRWPAGGVDLAGKRVGVIGTGSSAVQAIPIIAEQAAELVVFQRTATYTVPAHNGPLDPEEQRSIKAEYPAYRAKLRTTAAGLGGRMPPPGDSALKVDDDERVAAFEARWQRGGLGFAGTFADIIINPEANGHAAEFVRGKIRQIVRDPATAALLSPSHVIGCKRLCIDSGYYETFNRANVRLVDVSSSPIEAIVAGGVQVSGRVEPLDTLVFATGFDAMTGALTRVDIRGRDGVALADAWAEGPRTYLGLGVPGFPNLFIITGPGSPSVLTNMVVSIEQHVEWIADCLGYLRANDRPRIEAENGAAEQWVAYVNAVAGYTLFPTCNSWYLGANIPGKPRVFMPLPGFPPYAQKCADVAAKGYEGFLVSG